MTVQKIDTESILSAMDRLRKLKLRNSKCGLLIAILCLVAIIGTVFLLYYRKSDMHYSSDDVIILFFSSIYFLCFVMLIIMFQRNSRDGNILFDSLSDRLEILKYDSASNNIFEDVRILLRQYSSSIELPLIQGKYASSIYFILVLFLYFFNVVMIFINKR